MKRNGFTMVELIFVIIIIGILSVAAIPKFGDIKDRAKINSEYSALSGLDSAIQAAIEFHAEDDNGETDVLWNGSAQTHANANTNKQVLSKIVKKGDNLRITQYINIGADGDNSEDGNVNDASNGVYDVLFIEGRASNSSTGVDQDGATDSNGKPDKNDFWVFNTSPTSVIINHFSNGAHVATTVDSGEMTLIDNDAKITSYKTDGSDVVSGEVSAELTEGTALEIK